MAFRQSRAPHIPDSPAFEAVATGAPFRDRIAIPVDAPAEEILRAAWHVTLADMKLARAVGELRYLPARLYADRRGAADVRTPFLEALVGEGTQILQEDAVHEIVTGSAGQLHRIVDQTPVHFEDRAAFDAFDDPDYEKLFMNLRVEPSGTPGRNWLVLEHATRPLSADAERKFRRYWRVIRPGGAFVSRRLLKAIRRRAEGTATRSVRATREERMRSLPGDGIIVAPKATLTHAITIRCTPGEVWPWLTQMGAGSRAGWYSYDAIDNWRRPSAAHIIPELQQLRIGMVFPALPGESVGFKLLAFEPDASLTLAWPSPDDPVPLVTWAFVLEAVGLGWTRLIVRVRVGDVYQFHGLPWPVGRHVASIVHSVMQRKQLLGIAARAERAAAQREQDAAPTLAPRKAIA